MSENTSESTQEAEDVLSALKNGDLADLMNRVQDAQGQIQKLRGQQMQPQPLMPGEVASITSLIIHDMRDVRADQTTSPELRRMIDLVLMAAVRQHGRLLEVDFGDSK